MKGSPEAKAHMAKLRSMRKEGGKVNVMKSLKNFGRTPAGKVLKSIGKSALKSVADAGITALATVTTGDDPVLGSLIGSQVNPIVNKQINIIN